jgi:dTDP-4-amino-4,6-dideoxygalactose transaminase
MRQDSIHVTQSFLPPKEEYEAILEKVWETNWLTNLGPLVKQLEKRLKDYLRVDHMTLMTNGTFPIQIAIKALGLKGEIITTPFSYVATTSTIIWEGCEPVFVDIDPHHLTIDETKIEAAITSRTCAIMATHVYGNPCHVEAIDRIAKKHNLKVIYDAAHCFGVNYKGKSIFSYGDVSTCSFHATKIFHTGEGGCIISNDEALQKEFFNHHNFGHKNNEEFYGLGVNAKMSELQAAMGLAVLNHFDEIKLARKKSVENYRSLLKDKPISFLQIREHAEWNYPYFPIFMESEEVVLETQARMHEQNIFPRRYFFPSLNNLPYIQKKFECPISEDISRRVLCLPLYVGLSSKDQERVTSLIHD